MAGSPLYPQALIPVLKHFLVPTVINSFHVGGRVTFLDLGLSLLDSQLLLPHRNLPLPSNLPAKLDLAPSEPAGPKSPTSVLLPERRQQLPLEVLSASLCPPFLPPTEAS